MNKYLGLVLLLALFIPNLNSWAASKCMTKKTGKIRYFESEKEVITKEPYCFDSEQQILMSDSKCKSKEGQVKTCVASSLDTIKMNSADVFESDGTPGFTICFKNSGTPQLMEYWDGKKWIKSSRCIFGDNSFVDISTLNMKVEFDEK